MTVYIAVQRGVYRHDIVAACATLARAKVLGEAAIAAEPDHYHEIEIVARELDGAGAERLIGTLTAVCGPVQTAAASFDERGKYTFGKRRELLSVTWNEAQ